MRSDWEFGVSKELRLVEAKIRESIQSDEPLLTTIARYVIDAGGKRVRPTVTLLAFRAAGGKDVRQTVDIAAALELIHSATLLHDDINDGGDMRRGRMAAYKRFGLQNALVTGDFLFVKSFAIGGRFDSDIVELTAQACTYLAEGEIRQKKHVGDVAMTAEEYIDVIRRKTAMPISAGARLGAILAGATMEQVDALGAYGENLGIAFQIVDDILDVLGDEDRLGKKAGTDVREGTVTLLVIHAMNNGSSANRTDLTRVFRKERKAEEEVRRALAIFQECGAVEKAREDARRYAEAAKQALAPIPRSPYKRELHRLVDYVLTRDA
jgi:octaprenyl-diphosphate synthase